MANIELDGANKKIKVDSGDLTLDVPGDIILDADGADLVFADGGTNILKVTNSSSDAVFQPQVDAKDIKFNQYDGRTLLDINDGGFVGIANGATGPGQLRLYEDTDNGTNYTALQVGTQSGDITYTLPTADGSNGNALLTNGSGTLSWGSAGASLSNDANNRVVTGDGSGGLNGEANLTFDGNALVVAGTAPSITVGDAGAEDTKVVFDGNALDFHVGLDDSTDLLTIGKGSALGTTAHMTFDTDGHILKPLQPAFSVYASAGQDVSNYSDNDVVFGGEDFDVGSNFASNTFTAPVAGKYVFSFKSEVVNAGGWIKVKLVPSGKQYQWFATGESSGSVAVSFHQIVDMAASDTAKVTIVADDNNYSIIGDSGSTYHQSTFSGYLLG